MRRPVNGKEENEGFDHHSASITAFQAALTVICCSDADSSDSRAGLFSLKWELYLLNATVFFQPSREREGEK